MTTLGTLVRSAREARGWSTVTLAGKLGVSQSTLSRIENDKFVEAPEPRVLHAIAKVLNIPESETLRSLGYRVIEEETVPYNPVGDLINDWSTDQIYRLRLYIESINNERDRARADVQETG